jgi:charged multivesicular body protein 4
MNLFGRKKSVAKGAPPKKGGGGGGNSTQASLTKLKETISNMEKREDYIMKKVNNQLKIAKEKNKAGDKRGAMFALKKKKMYEKEIDKLGNARITLEQQILAIESASVNVDVVQGFQTGKNALKNMQKMVDVDAVADLQNDVQELMDDMEDVNNAISQPLGADYADEDELMAELEEFEESDLNLNLDEELNSINALPEPGSSSIEATTLPEVPDDLVNLEAEASGLPDDEEAALAALSAQMAL